MPPTTAADDILDWASSRLDLWQRDALRRLAGSPELTPADLDELLAMVKQKAGFALLSASPVPVPLDKGHLGASSGAPTIRIKAVRNIKNVNKLAPTASLSFKLDGLTVIYGTNGSGKTGFIRILRRACRTRITDQNKLKILADVYGIASGPNAAEIIIETAGGEQVIPWTEGTAASELMLRVAVFDSKAAELYVDQGNQIRFLPFGLALPHKLNEVGLAVRSKLNAEHQPVQQQLALTKIEFAKPKATKAQIFYTALTGDTKDVSIDVAASFGPAEETRLAQLEKLLVGSAGDAADRRSLAEWLEARRSRFTNLTTALSASQIEQLLKLREEAAEARKAADLAASGAFAAEPLPGVGAETWRRLWEAARAYSTANAYPNFSFPVSTPLADGTDPRCVLCQQPLDTSARERFARFEVFVTGSLAKKAREAEDAFGVGIGALRALDTSSPADVVVRIKQTEARFPALANSLTIINQSFIERHEIVLKVIAGDANITVLPDLPALPDSDITVAANRLNDEAGELESAIDAQQRASLEAERQELLDSRLLTQSLATLKKRRDLLKQDSLYQAAIDNTQTKGITQRANELIDKHLTKLVTNNFEAECKALDINYLRISLSRESGRTEAVFKTDTGTKLTRTSSDILSEGEQRALALAGFLTETTITAPDGPIIIDDPVSSLDRQRSARVATRIVEEAKQRQVIVFTHDLVFYNELCRIADDAGLEPQTCRLFRNANGTGLVDPSGEDWKSMKVSKRIAMLKNEMVRVGKLQHTEPSRYEYEAKNVYGRLRDAYERAVEECLFHETISRFNEAVKTQNLRYVDLPDEYAVRFHEGMTKANTFSHDNPYAGTATIPEPYEINADITALETLVANLKKLHDEAEKRRPQMKPH
jgi:energy-coupling factor transporter ATP-binding protein EcfA2